MKSVVSIFAIFVCAVCSAAGVLDTRSTKKSDGRVERSVAADGSVTVTLCVMAGEITVRGWDKNEVRARSADAEQIELRRVGTTDSSKPATKIDVFINDKSDEQNRLRADCQASADIQLDVPKGATVQVQTRDGNISIANIEAAYAGSQNGDICIDHVAQRIEAGSVGGGIEVRDSHGRVSLSSAGGGIEVTNVSPVEADDSFEVVSISGDIQLEKVTHGKFSARSVTGNINLEGPLAHSGKYGFSTTSGDVTLVLPADSSFRLVAKLAQDGEINTEFPLTLTTEPAAPPQPRTPKPATAPKPSTSSRPATPAPVTPAPKASATATSEADERASSEAVRVFKVTPMVKGSVVVAGPYPVRTVVGVCGTGDALLTVNSFSGNLRLQKN
jgi:cell division septation protein DedD